MSMLLLIGSVCSDPDLLKVLSFVQVLIIIARVLLPLVIIGLASWNFGKLAISNNYQDLKTPAMKLVYSVISGIIVFFVPTVVNVIMGFAAPDMDIVECFDNATPEKVKAAYITRADIELVKAEASLDRTDYSSAAYYVSQIDTKDDPSAETTKSNYEARLEIINKTIEDKEKGVLIEPRKPGTSSSSGSGKLTMSGSQSSNGTAVAVGGQVVTSEPDPSAALNYWKNDGKIPASEKFVYPVDDKGQKLGAWPADYSKYPTQINNPKVYNYGFIFPVTPSSATVPPVEGTYHEGYNHAGIDLVAKFGSPIYSPVDGTIRYSTWGHTRNKGADETAYSVRINLEKPFSLNGNTYDSVFLTHMCGIVQRCDSGCNIKVKKGQLIGFVGNAAGDSKTVSWVPHLHMTIYDGETAMWTGPTQNQVYGIKNGQQIAGPGK